MAEIKFQQIEKDGSASFPLLTRFELEALLYALRKLTRGWQLQERESDERQTN